MKYVLRYIIRFIAKIFMYRIQPHVEMLRKEKWVTEALFGIPTKGKGIRINGKVIFTNPLMVVLGSNIHIGNGAYCYTDGGLIIGDNVHISRNVTIYTSNHEFEGERLPYDENRVLKSVVIKKNVWIGMNVSIVPGVTIGEGAIIGLGTVVTKNVPPLAIVGNAENRILKMRDKQHYYSLNDQNKFGSISGASCSVDIKKMQSVFDLGGKLFFVVGTGRSGSYAITKTLSQHPDVECRHEAKGQLIRLSTEYAHGVKDREKVKQELIDLYSQKTISTSFYGESDQKLTNLIPILHEIFPEAKFLWLLRDARKVVASTYARGWFDDREFHFDKRDDVCVEKIFSDKIYSQNRLNGYKVGEFTADEWKDIAPFERNCWYWVYWNHLVKNAFDGLPKSNVCTVHLETLTETISEVTDFLGLSPFDFMITKSNVAQYDLKDKWSIEEETIFKKYCFEQFENNA